MIAVTTIRQEIQVKETFAIEENVSSDLKDKTIALTINNQFTTLGNVVYWEQKEAKVKQAINEK